MPSIRRTLTIFAMPVSPARILEDLSPFYRQEEFPVLLHQCETWAESRPLEGCRVIDASPVFRNTCAKYAALLAAGAETLLPKPWSVLPAMLLEVCSGCDCASRTGLWASTLCCAALSVQGASVLLQVRTICPPEVSLGPLLAARVLHLPLSLALFWLVMPGTEQAVQAFSTLSGRVVVMHRVPLDCALLAFAVCCIAVAELQKRCSGQCGALHDQHKKTAAR